MKKLKGFTLLELIVVMAIFSMIAVGALAIVQPAMRLFTSTAQQEEMNACTDNMKRYIEDNLRYANRLYYCEGYSDIKSIMDEETCVLESFKRRYFPLELNTTVYVMEIDGGTVSIPAGTVKIYKVVDFSNSELEEVSSLNSQFYESYSYNIDITPLSSSSEDVEMDGDFYFNINVFDKENNDLWRELPSYDVSFYLNAINLEKSVIVNNGEDPPPEDKAIDTFNNDIPSENAKYYFIYTVPEIIIP